MKSPVRYIRKREHVFVNLGKNQIAEYDTEHWDDTKNKYVTRFSHQGFSLFKPDFVQPYERDQDKIFSSEKACQKWIEQKVQKWLDQVEKDRSS